MDEQQKKPPTEEEVLAIHGVFDTSLEHLLKCPVPFTLQMYGNGSYVAKWEPKVPSSDLPLLVTGASRTSARSAMLRLWAGLYQEGVL